MSTRSARYIVGGVRIFLCFFPSLPILDGKSKPKIELNSTLEMKTAKNSIKSPSRILWQRDEAVILFVFVYFGRTIMERHDRVMHGRNEIVAGSKYLKMEGDIMAT